MQRTRASQDSTLLGHHVQPPTHRHQEYPGDAGRLSRIPTGGPAEDRAPHAPIRVVLVDDYLVIRSMTRRLLSLYPDMVVVGEAGNGVEALDVVAQVQPDVVLMDVYMPILDGVATTQQMCAAFPGLPIVLFTSCDQDGYVLEGVRRGAVGYLLKTAGIDLVVATLRGHSSSSYRTVDTVEMTCN